MKKILIIIILIVAVIAAVVAGFYLLSYQSDQMQYSAEMKTLSDMKSKAFTHQVVLNGPEPDPPYTTVCEVTQLRLFNYDCIGWVYVPGTKIDYPVMQNFNEPEFYLDHNFEREENKHGVPFADARYVAAYMHNALIYGHDMLDDTMFSDLHNYKDEDFLAENPYIVYTDMIKRVKYKIVAVLLVPGEVKENEESIYNFLNLSTQEEWEQFGDYLDRENIYGDCELPEEKTDVVSLSTCEYSQDNGRLVVVAVAEERMSH